MDRTRSLAFVAGLALLVVPLAAAPALAVDNVTVTGTVTVSGAPLPGSPVGVGWFEPATGRVGEVETAVGGAYSLDVPLDLGGWVLFANAHDLNGGAGPAPSFQPSNSTFTTLFSGADDVMDYAWQALTPRPSPSEDLTVDVDLSRGGKVQGTVPALAGLTVYLLNAALQPVYSANGRMYVKTAGADGAFSFEKLTPGRYRVQGSPTANPRYTSEIVTVSAGSTVTVTRPAPVGATIEGVVRYHGVPKAGIVIRLGYGSLSATTDAQGRYRFTGLTPGVIKISEQGAHDGWTTGVATVRTTAGATTVRDLSLVRQGSVTFTLSRGIPDTSMAHEDGQGIVQSQSGENVYTVDPGTYWLYGATLDRSGWTRKLVEITAGHMTDAGVLRATSSSITVSGTVSGGDSAHPKTVSMCDMACNGYPKVDLVGPDGRYTLRNVIPWAQASIYVSEYGWEPGTVVRRLASSQTVDLALGPQLSKVQARFVHDGLPVDVDPRILSANRTIYGHTRLLRGADGVYRSDYPIPSGPARLVIAAQSYGFVNGSHPFYWAPANSELNLAPGKNNLGPVELVLHR